MTVHLQEVVRSEVEDNLTGPANPIPSQSIDCGCGQLPCPKLVKFATRRLFVGLLSWVGLVQAAAYAYFYVAGPTIARRFQFDLYVMEWVLIISDLTPLALGILVAYWGDRIHRAAWIGGLVLLQSVSYFIMIIPHLTHRTKVIEESGNITHSSIYADDSRELCLETSSRIVAKENDPCYFTFAVIVVVQIITGVANISYFALGISYLDDNTKKKNVAAFIGTLTAVKIVGILLGSVLAWGCLRVDAVTLNPIESYREQIGAWWLGLPILTTLLVVPGLLLSWFPRMLLSQAVEKAAASLISNSDRYHRAPRRLVSQNVGSSNFWPSLVRLLVNKTLICHVLACALYVAAIMNFMAYENIIAQSRFHVPKPTGMLLGFEDPVPSRLISNTLKPVLVGLIVIITGLVITKAKPSARSVIGYSVVVVLLTCAIIFSLSAAVCEDKPIVGTTSKNSLVLLKYCNRNCGCSNDADFRPVCDFKGTFTFYSACHAGCTSSEEKNGVTTYNDCSCVEEMAGVGNNEAIDGPCNSNACQISWIAFEFGTLLAYVLIASIFVGDLLIILRSVNAQDKAIGIGLWMTCTALLAHVLGKILYDAIANLTCQYWGSQRTLCRLHNGLRLGNYLCYLTGSLLALAVVFKIAVWFFCKNIPLYTQKEQETATAATELQELIQNPPPAKQHQEPIDSERENGTSVQVEVTSGAMQKSTTSLNKNIPAEQEEEEEKDEDANLKYGPMGPGNRRTNSKSSLGQISQNRRSGIRNIDTEDELSSSDEEGRKDSSPRVAYRPLDLDSDVESDLTSVEPRSRKRIASKDYDPISGNDQSSSTSSSAFKREFPNPDNYEDPRLSRMRYREPNQHIDGSSKTSSFEFSRKRQDDAVQKKGDFNEVGIPIVDSPDSNSSLKDVKSLINRYELNAELQATGDQDSVRSGESGSRSEGRAVPGIPLVAMAPRAPSSKTQSSSGGFNSLVHGKALEDRPESRESVRSKASSKGSAGTLHTDF